MKHTILRKYYLIIFLLAICTGVFAQASTKQVDPEVRAVSLLPELSFAPEGGFYKDKQLVELFSLDAEIYYTTDGTLPRRISAHKYRKALQLKETTVIRAIAYRGNEKSFPISHTYFFDEPESKLPIVSIAITPALLFDTEKGLFVEGENANDSLWRKPGANFWSRKEVAINTEFFEPDSLCYFRGQTGMRLFGGMSRLFPQKSLTLVARSRYGTKRMKHDIFGNEGFNKYKFLVLRNSGSDFGKTHFRDAFMTGLLEDWDLEKQDARPAQVYINGEYWGIYNIREKINRYFLNGHFDIDKDSVDIIEHRLVTKRDSPDIF